MSPSDLPKSKTKDKKDRGTVVAVSYKLGTPLQECPEWLVATAKDLLPQPERLAFTPPARGEGEYHISLCVQFKCEQFLASKNT